MSTEVLDITVDQLASWLFGYMPLDGILEEDGTEPPFWCRYIRPLEGIFLDEIVSVSYTHLDVYKRQDQEW